MAEQDLYAILEVKKTASVDEIRRSYRGLAKQVSVKIKKLSTSESILTVTSWTCPDTVPALFNQMMVNAFYSVIQTKCNPLWVKMRKLQQLKNFMRLKEPMKSFQMMNKGNSMTQSQMVSKNTSLVPRMSLSKYRIAIFYSVFLWQSSHWHKNGLSQQPWIWTRWPMTLIPAPTPPPVVVVVAMWSVRGRWREAWTRSTAPRAHSASVFSTRWPMMMKISENKH